jgi:acyl carrier protein
MMPNQSVDRSPEALRTWLVERLAAYVRRPVAEIATDVSLAEYGLDSVSVFPVVDDIESHLGLTVEPTVMWDNPTIDALVGVLLGELSRQQGAP